MSYKVYNYNSIAHYYGLENDWNTVIAITSALLLVSNLILLYFLKKK